MNQKDQRILKLRRKGLDLDTIARKIGYGGDLIAGHRRIEQALNRHNPQRNA